jgi:hypothetical protein
MIIGISGKKNSGKDELGKILQWKLTRPDIAFSSFLLLPKYDRDFLWNTKQFASKVKEIVALLIGCTVEDLENREFKESPLGKHWERYVVYLEDEFGSVNQVYLCSTYEEVQEKYGEEIGYRFEKQELTPRMLLQLVGTDAGRKLIHPEIWINSLFADYDNNFHATKFSVRQGFNDPRYPNWIITDVRFPNEVQSIISRGGTVVRIERENNIIKNTATNLHESETALDNFNFEFVVKNDGTLEDLRNNKVVKTVADFAYQLK